MFWGTWGFQTQKPSAEDPAGPCESGWPYREEKISVMMAKLHYDVNIAWTFVSPFATEDDDLLTSASGCLGNLP